MYYYGKALGQWGQTSTTLKTLTLRVKTWVCWASFRFEKENFTKT